ARDTRIGRNVAIKVLSAARLSRHADVVQRFELEARAVGGLNHPNLLPVHDFETHEGVRCLVTEYLEGHSLRDRLDARPLPPRRGLCWGRRGTCRRSRPAICCWISVPTCSR